LLCNRIEEVLQQKTERLQKRLDEMHNANMKREVKRQEEEKKRQTGLDQHHDEVRSYHAMSSMLNTILTSYGLLMRLRR